MPANRAAQLQRLYYLDILEAEAKEAVAYLRLIEAYSAKIQGEKTALTQSINETAAAIKRVETQRIVLTRQVRDVRAPAGLTAVEYERLTGQKLFELNEDTDEL